jgi:hypothetical protein
MSRMILRPLVVSVYLSCAGVAMAQEAAKNPIPLSTGPHLLLDDYLIAKSEGVERKVVQPKQFLDEPIVTGRQEHQNWQPFFTVLHDPMLPAEKRFRMWYNVDVLDDPTDGAFAGKTALLGSADGIRWPGPYQQLSSLAEDGRYRIGASVLDDGPQHKPAAERYKIMYYDAGKDVGPRVAFSPDGVTWTMHNEGKPALIVGYGNDIWTVGYDPARTRYYLIRKLLEPYSWTNAEGQKLTENIRRCQTSFSSDFRTWSTPKTIFQPDEKDTGITQWYGAAGLQSRGSLIVGFLRELRDDLSPEGAPQEAIDANTGGHAGLGASALKNAKGSGVGYTVLIWSRDGETWHRDRYTDKFLEPDPKIGDWDHAMAWVGSAVPVDDEVYLYYVGYRWGHKHHHSLDRQIGLAKVMRDRYVARQAGTKGGTLTTPLVTLDDNKKLTLNADATDGELRVQIRDAAGEPIPGLTFADCRSIKDDSLNAPVQWQTKSLVDVAGKPVRLEFAFKNASLFAFDLAE